MGSAMPKPIAELVEMAGRYIPLPAQDWGIKFPDDLTATEFMALLAFAFSAREWLLALDKYGQCTRCSNPRQPGDCVCKPCEKEL